MTVYATPSGRKLKGCCVFLVLLPQKEGSGAGSHQGIQAFWRNQVCILVIIGRMKEFHYICLSIYLYTSAVSPSLGGSRQHKRATKTTGTPLRSSSNDEGPSRVWMALLEQHSPSSPVFHNLRRFTDAISPTAPTTGLQ